MKLLGITGKKRSGKDTISDYLVEKYGYIKYAFADPLKMGVKEMFGFNDQQMWGSDKDVIDERWGVSPRDIVTIMGTELLQFDIHKHTDKLNHIGRKIWVHRFKMWYDENKLKYDKDISIWFDGIKELLNYDIDYSEAIKLSPRPQFKVIVSDIRFKHEAEIIKELGGVIIKIERPSLNDDNQHLSETEMDKIDYDFQINNDSSVSDLYDGIDGIISPSYNELVK